MTHIERMYRAWLQQRDNIHTTIIREAADLHHAGLYVELQQYMQRNL